MHPLLPGLQVNGAIRKIVVIQYLSPISIDIEGIMGNKAHPIVLTHDHPIVWMPMIGLAVEHAQEMSLSFRDAPDIGVVFSDFRQAQNSVQRKIGCYPTG